MSYILFLLVFADWFSKTALISQGLAGGNGGEWKGSAAKLWRRNPAVHNLVSATAKKQYLIKKAVVDQWNEGVKIRFCKEPAKGETKQKQSITSDCTLHINEV